MTWDEVLKSDAMFLLAKDVAPIIGTNANHIQDQAHEDPDKLGFPVIVHGSRVKIPRMGFIYFMQYGKAAPPVLAGIGVEG
jgi:hypothetical protein